MSHLDDLITNELTGEVSNYDILSDNTGSIKVEFKQTYIASQDMTTFKWKIKSALYTRMIEDTSALYDGISRQDILLNIYNDYIYLSTGTTERGDTSISHFEINKNTRCVGQ